MYRLKLKNLIHYVFLGSLLFFMTGCELVMDYHFDECSRSSLTITDSSDVGNHATAKHGPGNSDGLYAQTCNGSGDIVCNNALFRGEGYSISESPGYYTAQYYMEAPDTAKISPLQTTKKMSLSAWFKTSLGGEQTIIAKAGDNANTREYRLWIDSGTLKITIWNKDGSDTTQIIKTGVNDGQWHQIAISSNIATFGNKLNIRGYVDKVLQLNTTVDYSGYSTNTTGKLYIGAMHWGSGNIQNYFNGNIDEIHMTDDESSASDIASVYDAEKNHKTLNSSGNAVTRTCPCSCLSTIIDYRFDECLWNGTSGEVKDSGGSNYHATPKSANASAIPQVSTQIINNGALFSRANQQYIELPTLAQNAPNFNNGFTVTAWAKFSGSAGFWERIFDIGNGTDVNNIFLGRQGTTNNLVLGIHDPGTSQYLVANNAISDTNWHFWGATCNGSGGCKLYKDGVKIAESTTMKIPANVARTKNYIGKSNWSADAYLEGGVDELKFFDATLSDSNIATIYTNESADKNYDGSIRTFVVCIPAPLVEYRFDECSWSGALGDVIDSSNNYDAQPINSANVNSTDTKMCNSTDLSTANKYIELPSNNYIPVAASWSLASWVKFPLNPIGHQTISGYNYFILGSVQNGGDLGYFGRRTTTGAMVFGAYSITGGSTEVSIATPSNGWHHVIFVNNGTTTSYYLDGTFITSVNKTVNGNIRYIATSYDNPTGQNMGTLLDEYKIFSVALNTAQITTLVSRESTGYQYDGTLRNCPTCNITPDPTFAFDAWDNFRSINDRNISTKIVNKPFTLTVAALNEANTAYQEFNGTVCAKIINNADQNISGWNKLLFNDQNSSTTTFTINRAIGGSDSARVKLYWKKNVDTTCPLTAEDNTSIASDRFSVRPSSFAVTTTNAVAGVDFNITLTAPIYGATTASSDYNESAGGTFDVAIAEHNASCATGTFSPTPTSFSFLNGSKTLTTRYSEVGILDLNITDTSKTCASRYTLVDCDDANVSDGTNFTADLLPIGLTQKSITITPHHFDVNATLSNFDGGTFTYLSNDLNMSAQLDLNITAKNGEGNTTTNYTSGCYSKDTTVTLPHSTVPSSLSKILYHDSITLADTNITKASSITSTYDASKFIQGIVTPRITLNFDRNSSTPLNPFDFNITSATATDADSVTGTTTPLGDTTFVYGRVHAYDIKTDQISILNPIEIEIYAKNSNHSILNGKPQNVLNWYRNTDHNDILGGVILSGDDYPTSTKIGVSTTIMIDPTPTPENGIHPINIINNDKITDKKYIHLTIPLWLWNSITSYSDLTNSKCTQHPCFQYHFTDSSMGVNGVNSGTFQGSDFQMAPAKNITNKGVKLFR